MTTRPAPKLPPSAARVGRELLPLALAALGLSALYVSTGRPVQLVVDGAPRTVRTYSRRVESVLAEAGVAVGAFDRVSPKPELELQWDADRAPAVNVERARPVTMVLEGGTRRIHSPETSAANLLSQAGWTVYPGDRLSLDGLPSGLRGEAPVQHSIELDRGFPIALSDDGLRREFYSSAPTVGAALGEVGVVLHQGDRVTPAADSTLTEPLSVEIVRSQPLVIQSGEVTVHTRSAASTVAGALAEAGVPLVGLDYTVPAADGPLPSDGIIRVVQVHETVTLEQEPLPFEIRYQPLDSLEIDQRQVLEAGSYGVRTNRIRVRFEDGEEVDRSVEGEWIAQEPTPQIIGYGTRIEIRTVATADGTLEYWRAVEMYATSYSPSRAGVSLDSPWFGITASGKPLKKGLVAIDRSLIPFGTQMYVPGYGFAEAADTGSGVKGRWIDLGYEDDNWVSWSGYVTVYFLTPVPDSIVYVFP